MRGASYAFALVRLGLLLVLLNAFQFAVAPIPFRSDLTSSLLGHSQDVSEATAPSGVQRTMQSVTDSLSGFLRSFQAAPLAHKPVLHLSPETLIARTREKNWLDSATFRLWGQGREPDVDAVSKVLLEMTHGRRFNENLDASDMANSIHIAEQAAKSFAQARAASSISSETSNSYVKAIQQAAEIFTAELEKLRKLEIIYDFIRKMGAPEEVQVWLKAKVVRRRAAAVEFHPRLRRVVEDAKRHPPTFEMLELNAPKRNWSAFKPLGYFKPIPVVTQLSGAEEQVLVVKEAIRWKNYPFGLGVDGGLGPLPLVPSSNKQAGPSGLGTGGGY